MPWYDIECGACGETGEAFQKMDAKQPTRCSKCGVRKVRRVLIRAPAAFNSYPPDHPRKNRGRG